MDPFWIDGTLSRPSSSANARVEFSARGLGLRSAPNFSELNGELLPLSLPFPSVGLERPRWLVLRDSSCNLHAGDTPRISCRGGPLPLSGAPFRPFFFLTDTSMAPCVGGIPVYAYGHDSCSPSAVITPSSCTLFRSMHFFDHRRLLRPQMIALLADLTGLLFFCCARRRTQIKPLAVCTVPPSGPVPGDIP